MAENRGASFLWQHKNFNLQFFLLLGYLDFFIFLKKEVLNLGVSLAHSLCDTDNSAQIHGGVLKFGEHTCLARVRCW